MSFTVVLFDGLTLDGFGPPNLCNYGGAQHIRRVFIEDFLAHSRALSVVFATRTSQKSALQKELLALKLDIEAVAFPELLRIGHSISRAVVHCLGPSLAGASHLSAAASGARWPVTVMTHDLFDPAVFQDLLLASAIERPPTTAIACASRAARSTADVMVARIAGLRGKPWRIALPILPHGVRRPVESGEGRHDTRRSLGLSPETLMILYLGRLSARTKVDVFSLLEVFGAMTVSQPVRLVLAGSAAEPDEVDHLRRTIGAQCDNLAGKVVSVHASISEDEKDRLLRAADIFVSPANSLQESFGLALVEAMMHGLPVVATDWNGYRDIIADGRTGILIPTFISRELSQLGGLAPLEDAAWLHDTARRHVSISRSALRTALERLAADLDLRTQLGGAARQAAARFTVERMFRRYDRLWERLIRVTGGQPMLAAGGLSYDIAAAFRRHPTLWSDTPDLNAVPWNRDPDASQAFSPQCDRSKCEE